VPQLGNFVLDHATAFWYILTIMVAPIDKTFQALFFQQNPTAQSVMALFEALPHVSFYAKDKDSRYIRMNAPCVQALGCGSEEEVLGKSDRDFHPPILAEGYVAEDKRVMASGQTLPGQVWLVYHARRMPVWYVSSKTPLFSPMGKVIGIAGVMYPIENAEEQQQHFHELSGVIAYMERHYAEGLSMHEMAERAGLSDTHFNRRFQQLLRMTPTDYLHTVRVQVARRLLSETQRTIAEVAMECGYCDQSHLTRHFRKLTGIPPASYRRRFQQRGQS
jgi:AraC-like DNA-binding protein